MPGTVQSIERAAAVLRLLAQSTRPLGVVEIAHALSLPKGTAHGIIRTLHTVGFVDQDDRSGRYLLGTQLVRLGGHQLDRNELRSCAMNWTDTLASRTGETVKVAVLDQPLQLTIVHHVFRPDDSIQVMEIGAVVPAHASAMGKAILAHTPGTAARLKEATLEAFTSRTVTDGRALVGQLSTVRERGWAADVEELSSGEASIAAAIRDHGGVVVGSVGIIGAPRAVCDGGRNPRPRLAARVVETARAITGELTRRRE
ncbi:MAG: IclR family transcriptional regulator [Nitriliruptoraceae bacterium]